MSSGVRCAWARTVRARVDPPPDDVDGALIAIEVFRAGDVHVAGARMHGDVLWPVERRRTETIRGLTATQHDVALRGEALLGRELRMLTPNERQPLASAVLEKPRDVQRARVEQVAVAPRTFGIETFGGHEFVEILELLVVAHVHDHAAIAREDRRGGFVLEPSQGCPFLQRPIRIEWVELDDPTELQGLGGIHGIVETPSAYSQRYVLSR